MMQSSLCSGLFVAGADRLLCGATVLACLVTRLPLMGGHVRGYAAPCTGLWIIDDRRGNNAC
jgi:hypothetical protein